MNFRAKFIIVLFSWESRSTTLFLFLSPFVFQVETLGFIRAVLFFTDRSGQSHENIFDIFTCFYRSWYISHSMLTTPFCDLRLINFFLQIIFISNKQNYSIFGFSFTNLIPLLDHIFERLLSRLIKN